MRKIRAPGVKTRTPRMTVNAPGTRNIRMGSTVTGPSRGDMSIAPKRPKIGKYGR